MNLISRNDHNMVNFIEYESNILCLRVETSTNKVICIDICGMESAKVLQEIKFKGHNGWTVFPKFWKSPGGSEVIKYNIIIHEGKRNNLGKYRPASLTTIVKKKYWNSFDLKTSFHLNRRGQANEVIGREVKSR